MVGLHTCGDLASSTLRLFTAKPEIKAVCSVGCCYHLLSEECEPQKGTGAPFFHNQGVRVTWDGRGHVPKHLFLLLFGLFWLFLILFWGSLTFDCPAAVFFFATLSSVLF